MENLNNTNVAIQKHHLTSLFVSAEIMDGAMSTEITVQQAKDYINNHNNPEKYRNKISDLLRRYNNAIKDYPGRIIMRVDRVGLCSLWMD